MSDEEAGPEEASLDVSRVMAEVDDDVRRRRASGELPSARERELDDLFVAHSPASGQGANLRQALERVDRAMYVDPVVPVDSNHRAGGAIKKGMRSASLWYVGWLTHQINQFASATSRSLHLIEQRLIELEGGDGVQRAPRAEVVEFPELHGGEAWWVAPAIDAVGPAPGRTLHAACGDGWLVRRLVAVGRDAYGVDPRPGRAAPEVGAASDLRTDEVAVHLRAVVPGDLGAVILSGVVDGMAAGEREELLRLTTTALAPSGVLVLHSVTATTWHGPAAPVQADLCPGRPLRSGSWCALLDARGYHASVRPGPGEADYLVTAVRA
ncbi:MAG TPA: hypothetical protein VG074_12850 [Acidimicrobiales bacterium]|nr:hypothetical protein [Acidimicrobiales bacterium]